MDLARLRQLKHKLIHEPDFTRVFEYFLDHFGEDDRFLDLGRRVSDPFLEMLITAVGKSLMPGDSRLDHVCFVEIPGHAFIHGALRLNGRPANVLYFQDVCRGLLGLLGKNPLDLVHCVRFSADVLPQDWGAENN